MEFSTIFMGIFGVGIGLPAGYYLDKWISQKTLNEAKTLADRILDEARKEASAHKKEVVLAAQDELFRQKQDLEKEFRDKIASVEEKEEQVLRRRERLEEKQEQIVQKETELLAVEKRLTGKERELDEKGEELSRLAEEHDKRLQEISGLTMEEAKKRLMAEIESKTRHDAARMIRQIEMEAKETADKSGKKILALAIQRYAGDFVAEQTVTAVTLPSEEMKGRIIGREGRNIRALETATGVDLIIDDTPEAVIISGFDPVRREVARMTLEKLITDGRIHPARIEEVVEKSRREVENQIREAGEQAVFETNLHGIHPEIVKLLGRMKYRTSYGQNVLKHSIEVSHLAGVMAAELGADAQLAKRAGLLHDIGKAIDHEVEGTHVTIGVDLAKKFNESPAVINAIAAHHNDVEPQTVEAVLVQAADAISAARPGARRESLENYIKRLEKLEEISNSFEGVEKSYAIQSGREVRIIVKPEDVNDAGTLILAKEIVKRIEREMEYPGQIKVNVIRETRAVDFAK